MTPPRPRSTLFPYTTLFRSREDQIHHGAIHLPMDVVQTVAGRLGEDRKSTRLNSSHVEISYAVFCLKKKTRHNEDKARPPLIDNAHIGLNLQEPAEILSSGD